MGQNLDSKGDKAGPLILLPGSILQERAGLLCHVEVVCFVVDGWFLGLTRDFPDVFEGGFCKLLKMRDIS
jgi:hypothetical protein